MAKRMKVQSACRDCTKCTNSGMANLGRNSGRVGVATLTMGMSELVMTATKNCGVCGHKLSLHTGETISNAQVVVAASAQPTTSELNPARWVAQSDGKFRWWAGDRWTDEFSTNYLAPAPIVQPVEIVAAPLSIKAQPDGPDYIAQLKQLAELHDAGILTDDEFAAKKTEILARM